MDAAVALPSGVVTFVLTDIVGSTQLWEATPVEMEEALALHNKTLARAVESRGGVVMKPRGEGDSTFSVFQRASDAVRAAYEAQVELSRLEWPPETRIRVRVAIHAGEASEQDGDYLGTTVNRAARLRGVADGGEIVVSSSVAHLVADYLPVDTFLHSLGQVRLPGLDRREEVFVLTGPGLAPPGSGRRGGPAVDLLREKGVTKRERDVLDAVAERLTNAAIAARFSVSERTVETHVSALLRKLGAANRVELATVANELNASSVVELPPMLQMSVQRSVCVGRRDQRARLVECWDRASSGRTGLAVVTGEAGIGKSRLVAELALEVHRRSGRVLLGASTDGAHAPYQPFVEALNDTIALAPEGQLRTDTGRHLEPLSQVLPGLAARLGTFVSAAGVDPLGEQLASQTAVAALVAAMARRHPTLLVLEDLHWASSVTRDAVLHLARTGGVAPLLVVATARDTAPELDATLTRWLSDAARLPVCDIVPLTGLDLAATIELLAGIGGAIDPSAALQATAGNPLFLREVATAGMTSPTLRDFLANRYARLSDDDLDAIDVAAVIGESFGADLVAAAVDRPVAAVLDALDHATGAGLVEPIRGRDGSYAFAHALFRDARYDTLSAGRRLQLHAAVTTALLPRASDPTVLPDLARHACIAAPLGDPASALDLAERAGSLSAAVGDQVEAAQHFQRALDVVDLTTDGDQRRRLELTIRLGEALVHADVHRGHAILRDAARLARRLGDAPALADAVCSMTVAFGSMSAGTDDPTYVALAHEALSLLDDDETHWRSRLLALVGAHHALGSEPELGRTLVREAVGVARRSTDPLDLVRAILSLTFALDALDLDERLSTLMEAREICERQGHSSLTQLVAERLGVVHRTLGDFDAMRRYHQMALDCTPTATLGTLQTEGVLALLAGDLDLAEQRNAKTHEAAERLGVEHLYSGSLAMHLALWRGQPPTRFLEPLATGPSLIAAGIKALLAFSYLQDGRVEDARAPLDHLRTTGFDAIPPGMFRAFTLAVWGEVAAATNDTSSAQQILELLDPLAGQLADGAGLVWSSIDQVRAQLALTLNEPERARTIASSAVTASRLRGTPLFLARELLVLAQAEARLGNDENGIAQLVAEALSIADDTGAALIRAEAARHRLS